MFRQLSQVIFNGLRVPLRPVNLAKPVNPKIISVLRGKIPGYIPGQVGQVEIGVGSLRQLATATVKKTKPTTKKGPVKKAATTAKKAPAKKVTAKATKSVKGSTRTVKAAVKGAKGAKTVKATKSKTSTVKAAAKKKVAKKVPVKAKLKEKAKPRLPPKLKPPKKPGSAYVLFGIESYKEQKAKNPAIKLADASKIAAERWSTLQDSDKAIWEQRYKEARAQYLIDYNNWLENLTPDQYVQENRRRRMVSKAKGKKCTLLIDPKAPKKPKTPYMLYFAEHMGEFKDLKITERSKEAGRRWRGLSAEERKPYEDTYNKDREAYRVENEKYKNLHVQ